jgi:hypothetical protein
MHQSSERSGDRVAKAQAQLAIWKNLDGDDPLARSVRGA